MIQERTSDLSQFGCYVRTSNPCAVGTKVRVKITYKGAVFTALGHIVNVRENGMGVQFSGLAPRDEMILEIWMAELRSDGTRA